MDVRSRRASGRTGKANDLPALEDLANLYVDALEVAKHADKALPVVYENGFAVEEIVSGQGDLATTRCRDGGAFRNGNVEPAMGRSRLAVEGTPEPERARVPAVCRE